MQFHSSHAKHKLSIVALLLGLFAVPFVLQWHSVATTFDNKALMAGGAVIGGSASVSQQTNVPNTNHVGQLTSTVGNDFVGAMAQ